MDVDYLYIAIYVCLFKKKIHVYKIKQNTKTHIGVVVTRILLIVLQIASYTTTRRYRLV